MLNRKKYYRLKIATFLLNLTELGHAVTLWECYLKVTVHSDPHICGQPAECLKVLGYLTGLGNCCSVDQVLIFQALDFGGPKSSEVEMCCEGKW